MAVGPGRPRLQGEKRAEAAPLGAWVCEICKTDMSYLTNCARQVRPPWGPSITVTAPVRTVFTGPVNEVSSMYAMMMIYVFIYFILPPCIAYVRIYMLTTASCTL
jgi:hypothetical protein